MTLDSRLRRNDCELLDYPATLHMACPLSHVGLRYLLKVFQQYPAHAGFFQQAPDPTFQVRAEPLRFVGLPHHQHAGYVHRIRGAPGLPCRLPHPVRRVFHMVNRRAGVQQHPVGYRASQRQRFGADGRQAMGGISLLGIIASRTLVNWDDPSVVVAASPVSKSRRMATTVSMTFKGSP